LGGFQGSTCGWDLMLVAPTAPGQARTGTAGTPVPEGVAQAAASSSAYSPEPQPRPAAVTPGVTCPNGHPVEPGDLLCPACSADIILTAERPAPPAPVPTAESPPPAERIAGWPIRSRLGRTDGVRERFLTQTPDGDRPAVMTLYDLAREPDPEVYTALRRVDLAHVPAVLDFGRFQGRAYEVAEYLPGGHLGSLAITPGDTASLRVLAAELGAALDDLARVGVRHRDLRPEAILVRGIDPLDLVIGSFGSARLSDLDLDLVAPLGSSRYMAPEAIAGAVSPASDWWSLGVLLLEKVTSGACFAGVNDQAFLIHALVDGVTLPPDLAPEIATLLRGLLCRDRTRRWQWSQVRAWLAGEPVEAPPPAGQAAESDGAALLLGALEYRSPRRYALAAADPAHWDEASGQLVQGRLIVWLEERQADPRQIATLRTLTARQFDPDTALSLALKVINPDMPLIQRGTIVSPGWLLEHPEQGYALISGEAPAILADLGAEPWLDQLRRRALLVRERATYHAIVLVEERLRVLLLSTSQVRLRALWDEQRRIFPDTDHQGLAAIADRLQWGDEDLILLLAAETGQFRPIDTVVSETAELARWAGIGDVDPESARTLLREHTRRELFALVRERIADFASCDIQAVNDWAARFRMENRTQVPRALLILAIPAARWVPPPRQAYLGQLLEFFEQKAAAVIGRGPLARMSVARSGSRIDLAELGTTALPAAALLDQLVARTPRLLDLDPAALAPPAAVPPPLSDAPLPDRPSRAQSSPLESRLRNLARHTNLYRRDTGIDGLYLAFPFLLLALPGANLKPRIAPVLLWPIRLEADLGRVGRIRLGFDPEREEVRLNPALDGYLGPQAIERWRAAAQSALGRTATCRDLMDEFGRLATPRGRDLKPLPGIDVRVAPGPGEFQCSAVLFHMTFMGQAVIEDLRQLRALHPAGTALEPLLRMGAERPPSVAGTAVARPPELDRWFTVDSDPSQEDAVLSAREPPGLVVSGPPGTGKSQTIVNIVGDGLGRGRSVLVVCQKQAALEVVRKRLEKEGLAGRIMMVGDMTRDRLAVIRAVREQLDGLHQDVRGAGLGPADAQAERRQVAGRIEDLERQLDGRQQALHAADPQTGRSYRHLVSDLIGLESGARAPIAAPAVRRVLAGLDQGALARIEEQAVPLAGLWLAARFEDSPLTPLKPFAADEATRTVFARDLAALRSAERQRAGTWAAHPTALTVAEPVRVDAWLRAHAGTLTGLGPVERADLARWLDLFASAGDTLPSALLQRQGLERLQRQLLRLATAPPDPVVLGAVQSLSSGALEDTLRLAERALRPTGRFGVFNPLRLLRRQRLRQRLLALSLTGGEAGMQELLAAARYAWRLRELHQQLAGIERVLGEEAPVRVAAEPRELAQRAAAHITQLDRIAPLAQALADCPAGGRTAAAAARAATAEAMAGLLAGLAGTLARHAARATSLATLGPLGHWIEPDWIATIEGRIQRGDPDPEVLTPLEAALPHVEHFQRFRIRAAGLGAESLAFLGALRALAAALVVLPDADLSGEVRRILLRESALAAKSRLENACPELLAEHGELADKIARLAALDRQMRALNRRCLIGTLDRGRLGPRARWDDITRLTGPRAKRLREFVELGSEIGLMALRPIWLMTPGVASQVLPLKAAVFDLVIFDEASQMPVEYALPSLYRGGLVVVSGDEKQLPPTAFFASKVESDEAELIEGEPDPDASEDEVELAEERWNRREIKDCPDLLALARVALPKRMLEIHYRSSFRELIAFSNAAFYGGRLHVPVQHPPARVRECQPLRVVRVDGRYEHQTNPDEGKRIVDLLAELWSGPIAARPTAGVVTFNRKQADLIEEYLEARAEDDADFRDAYACERERRNDGEDVGFFVKNLESVQGDERDIVLFSTTFGRNAQGRFRRVFGALGQRGGERRLNVAVTRARDQVILVTSMPVAEVAELLGGSQPPTRPRDYLQAYLAYAEHLSHGDLEAGARLIARLERAGGAEPAAPPGELGDPFRMLVGEYIGNRLGLTPVAVASGTLFGVDWAIPDPAGGGFAIGIECDAPVHRLLAGARAREIWRPTVLARSIPLMHRVSSVAWHADPAMEQGRLAAAIAAALAGSTGCQAPSRPPAAGLAADRSQQIQEQTA
jgi:primosomal replication protein N''